MAWFVMLRSEVRRIPIPLVDREDDVAMFNSEEDAQSAGRRNIIGESYGFEVYEW